LIVDIVLGGDADNGDSAQKTSHQDLFHVAASVDDRVDEHEVSSARSKARFSESVRPAATSAPP